MEALFRRHLTYPRGSSSHRGRERIIHSVGNKQDVGEIPQRKCGLLKQEERKKRSDVGTSKILPVQKTLGKGWPYHSAGDQMLDWIISVKDRKTPEALFWLYTGHQWEDFKKSQCPRNSD